jgi:hypothetical protein
MKITKYIITINNKPNQIIMRKDNEKAKDLWEAIKKAVKEATAKKSKHLSDPKKQHDNLVFWIKSYSDEYEFPETQLLIPTEESFFQDYRVWIVDITTPDQRFKNWDDVREYVDEHIWKNTKIVIFWHDKNGNTRGSLILTDRRNDAGKIVNDD